jgi:cobalt-zinc-cadmium efflux system protein
MGAGHNHAPAANETGRPGDFRKKLWIAFGITSAIVVTQPPPAAR